jgi:Helix-turn-helix domain
MTLLAYRFALDPTPAQERALRSNAGAARARSTGAWPG